MKRRPPTAATRTTSRQVIAQAKGMRASGDFDGALKLLRTHTNRSRRDPDLLIELGKTAIAARQRGVDTGDEQVTSLEAATRLRPDDGAAHLWLGRARFVSSDFDGAADALRRAAELLPGDEQPLAALGQSLLFAGRAEEAHEALAPRAGELRDPTARWAYGEAAWRVGHEREGLDALRALGEDADAPDEFRRMAWFSLAKAHDRMERYDDAFEAARKAHELEPGSFEPDVFEKAVDRLIELFSPERMAELPRSGAKTKRPLFILGMPRSGTTLLERMLDRHPEIVGVGELPAVSAAVGAMDVDRLAPFSESDPVISGLGGVTSGALYRGARAYEDRIRRIERTARYAADKLPMNFLHLGVIALMLPNCRVLHPVRDPRDACLSYHTTYIAGPHARRADLTKLGRYYNGYARLMEHWKRVLDLPILDVRYTDVAQRPEETMRRVLEFLELPYEEGVTRPHEGPRVTATASFDQVSRPIHTGRVGRWRNYQRHLRPLLEALEPEHIPDEGGS